MIFYRKQYLIIVISLYLTISINSDLPVSDIESTVYEPECPSEMKIF